jgi:DNA-binding IclR family transcriptional regulator
MSTIRAIDRAFSILRLVAHHPEGVGVTVIAQAIELPKSTTSRILSTLERWEAVARTGDNRFQIGPELVRLVGQRPFSQNLSTLARPVLQEIADMTGEAVALCILDELQVYHLDHVQSQQAVRVRDWTGERTPLHISSAGKIFLAYGNSNLVETYLERPLSRYTGRTITSPDILRAQLPQIRRQGYAVSDEEFDDGVLGFAVPVLDSHGNVIAAINLYGPKFRIQDNEKRQQVVEILLAGAAELTKKNETY